MTHDALTKALQRALDAADAAGATVLAAKLCDCLEFARLEADRFGKSGRSRR